MKHCIVAGAAGFIGQHLCRRLLEDEDVHVLAWDDLSTGLESNLPVHPRLVFEKRDIVDLHQYIDNRTDCIFNLACPASPPEYQKDPIKTMLTNVMGTRNLLEIATRCSAVYVQASTSEVYGDPDDDHHPQVETYYGNVNPIGVRACYDEGKRAAETLCMDYHRKHGVNIKIVRIFNTFGPGMRVDDGRVVTNFIGSALAAKPLRVYGTGKQTRTLCYVDDLVNGILRMSDADRDIIGPVNLGGDEEISVMELARTIVLMTGSSSEIVHVESARDDPQQRKPHLGRAWSLLQWKPATNYIDGLRRTIEHNQHIQHIQHIYA